MISKRLLLRCFLGAALLAVTALYVLAAEVLKRWFYRDVA